MKNKVAEFRNGKGISQDIFAGKVGISRTHLSEIENEKVPNPGGIIILRIAKELKLPVEEIFFDDCVRHTKQVDSPKHKAS